MVEGAEGKGSSEEEGVKYGSGSEGSSSRTMIKFRGKVQMAGKIAG